ncbi:MAG: hypothetical protein V4590_07220 [Bacteroidota bacterium]
MTTSLQFTRPFLFAVTFLFTIWLAPLAVRAQVHININVQPAWGPVEYDYVEYYYLPEYEVYYDVPQQRFVYFDGGRWLFVASLPARFGVINYYSTYKVVINEPRAYERFHNHRVQYVKYKHGGHQQHIIRDSHSPKYKNRQQQIAPQGRVQGNTNRQPASKSGSKGNGGNKSQGGKKH